MLWMRRLLLNSLKSCFRIWILIFHKSYKFDSSHASLMVSMFYSWVILWKLLLPTLLRFGTNRFLAKFRCSKVFLQSILRMLLEIVFTMSSHPFGFLFFELKGYNDQLGSCLSIVFCLIKLWKSTKLKITAGTNLICWQCGGVIGSNAIAFTWDGAKDV